MFCQEQSLKRVHQVPAVSCSSLVFCQNCSMIQCMKTWPGEPTSAQSLISWLFHLALLARSYSSINSFECINLLYVRVLWSLRDKETGLLGNVVDVQTGEWVGLLSGLGAGIDSFFEYLLKVSFLFVSFNFVQLKIDVLGLHTFWQQRRLRNV